MDEYCKGCPDHEACSTGYSCDMVKAVHNEALRLKLEAAVIQPDTEVRTPEWRR